MEPGEPNVLTRVNVSEAVALERQLRSQAMQKHDELRNLVGERYRSLLSCADAISRMSELSANLEDGLQHLYTSLQSIGSVSTSMAATVAARMDAERQQVADERERIQIRVRFFGAAERVWSMLEAGELSAAAQEWKLAREDAEEILESNESVLFTQLWAQINAIQEPLLASARQCLSEALSRQRDQDALSALCTMQGLSGTAVVESLLDIRTMPAQATLPHCARLLRTTIYEAHHWFGEHKHVFEAVEASEMPPIFDSWMSRVVEDVRRLSAVQVPADGGGGTSAGHARDLVLEELFAGDSESVWERASLYCLGRRIEPWKEVFHAPLCEALVTASNEVFSGIFDQLRTEVTQLTSREDSSERFAPGDAGVDGANVERIASMFEQEVDSHMSQACRLFEASSATRFLCSELVDFLQTNTRPRVCSSCIREMSSCIEMLRDSIHSSSSRGHSVLVARLAHALKRQLHRLEQLLPSEELQQLNDKFDDVIRSGYARWATETAKDLIPLVTDGLENWSRSWSVIEKDWVASTWTQPENDLGSPGQPSPYVMTALYTLSQHLERIDGDDFDEMLLSHVMDHVSEILAPALDQEIASNLPVSSTALAQLLLDLRFMLVWSRRATSTVSALLERVRSSMDPIDLSAYEKSILESIVVQTGRCDVLLGSLYRLRAGADPRQSGKSSLPNVRQANLLPLAKPSQRLPRVPVSLYPTRTSARSAEEEPLPLEMMLVDDAPTDSGFGPKRRTSAGDASATSSWLSQVSGAGTSTFTGFKSMIKQFANN